MGHADLGMEEGRSGETSVVLGVLWADAAWPKSRLGGKDMCALLMWPCGYHTAGNGRGN